jgi:hypothetical protein
MMGLQEGWIEERAEHDFDMPLPIDDEPLPANELAANSAKFSGRFVLRLPKSLHARLAGEAEKEGVSLNQYVVYKLSVRAKKNTAAEPREQAE